jgi:hypothetical protein
MMSIHINWNIPALCNLREKRLLPSSYLFIRLVRKYKCSSHWTDFLKILYGGLLWKYVDEIQICLKCGKHIGILHKDRRHTHLPVNNSTTHPKLIHRFTRTSEPRATTHRDSTTTVTPCLEYSRLKRNLTTYTPYGRTYSSELLMMGNDGPKHVEHL